MNPQATSLSQDIRAFVRRWLSGRRGAILATLIVATIGLAFGWGWFVAVGIAPVLLSLLPCAAMCVLGLCMQRMGGKSCANQGSQKSSAATSNQVPPQSTHEPLGANEPTASSDALAG